MNRRFAMLVVAMWVGVIACSGTADTGGEANVVREREMARIDALVAADVEAAGAVLADDYVLVDPTGATWSKADYLDAVKSADLDYLSWTADSTMEVRIHGDAAVVKYRSAIVVSLGGTRMPGRFWHLELYEKRDDRWQVVWSQTTEIS